MSALIYPPPNRAIILKNTSCPYCGEQLVPTHTDKEHVIGRRFVPKGTLQGCWNLIVQSCRNCNGKKSDLEDDISAITLSGLAKHDPALDSSILQEAHRKATGSISCRTKRVVSHSEESLNIELPLRSGASVSIGLTAQPNIDIDRAFLLAHYQINGIYFFISSDDGKSEGGSFPHGFHPLAAASIHDWGNPVLKAYMQSVQDWEPCWTGTTAQGYFRSIIRVHPTLECWSWALEWNRFYRVVGFGGDREVCQSIVDSYPDMGFQAAIDDDVGSTTLRRQTGVSEDEDTLFEQGENASKSHLV